MTELRFGSRVAIIGCGPSGIAALDQFTRKGFDVVAYEAKRHAGGTWNHHNVETIPPCLFDRHGRPYIHDDQDVSPMYDNLRTNIAFDLMSYRDTRPPQNSEVFPHHPVVLSYLRSCSSRFSSYIRFNTIVTSVRSEIDSDGSQTWVVTTSSPSDLKGNEERFDFVVVANGHYNEPFIPAIDGLWNFQGEIVHSKWYRNTKRFAQKKVLVVGNKASGYDISRELALQLRSEGSLSKIYLSIRDDAEWGQGIDLRSEEAPEYAKSIEIVRSILKIDKDGQTLWLIGGNKIENVDVIIFATGYLYSFPFFNAKDEPWKSNNPVTNPPPVDFDIPKSLPSVPSSIIDGGHNAGLRVHHLDANQIFFLPLPTLAFLSLPLLVVPFSLAETQARLIAYFWSTYPRAKYPIKPPEDPDVESVETRKVHVIGYPKEYEYYSILLKEMGEGGKQAEGSEKWGDVEEWRVERRKNNKMLRKEILGY